MEEKNVSMRNFIIAEMYICNSNKVKKIAGGKMREKNKNCFLSKESSLIYINLNKIRKRGKELLRVESKVTK